MISRDNVNSLRDKPVQDERLFNNFKIQKHDLSKTCDFSKLKGRNLDFHLENMNGKSSLIQICTTKARKVMTIVSINKLH